MEENNYYKYTFVDENNNEVEYEILLSFKSDKYKKLFYIMTDNNKSENNKLNTFGFYTSLDGDEEFKPVTDDNEIELIQEVFNAVEKEIK